MFSNQTSSMMGKVALITGGSTGIGRAFALGFAKAGADVIVCSRTGDGLDVVAEEIRRLGHRSLPVRADISQKADVDNMIGKVINELGRIDVLINNAGIVVRGSLLDTEEDVWDKVINTNLKGCYLCCKAAGQIMVRQKQGCIINIASQYGFKAVTDRTAYSISKAGVIMLTRVLARELGEYNIRVNAIAPGPVKTRMNERWLDDPDAVKSVLSTIPLGLIADPEDLVGAALFLASDSARLITGATIVVDGGILA